MSSRLHSFITAVLCVCACFGQQGVPPVPPPAASQATPNQPPDYILRAGDEIEIRLFYHPDMNGSMVIRPDGKISFPLVGEQKADGLTPAELSLAISKRLDAEIKNSQSTVIVKRFSDFRFYVGGEVVNSGVYQLSQPMTTLQAILQAGGFKPTAQPKNIMIVRAVDRQTAQIIKLTLNSSSIEKLEAKNNIALQPLDIVYVPKSGIARANDFVEQYIKRLSPASLILGLNYNMGAFTFRE